MKMIMMILVVLVHVAQASSSFNESWSCHADTPNVYTRPFCIDHSAKPLTGWNPNCSIRCKYTAFNCSLGALRCNRGEHRGAHRKYSQSKCISRSTDGILQWTFDIIILRLVAILTSYFPRPPRLDCSPVLVCTEHTRFLSPVSPSS